MSLVHRLLEASARRSPDAPFLISDATRMTFADIDAMSSAGAVRLRAAGLRRGDRVALVLPNSIEFVVALFATLKAGGVVVPLDPDTTVDRLTFVLTDCEVRVVFAADVARPVVGPAVVAAPSVVATLWAAEAREWPSPGGSASSPDDRSVDADLALILYTSGSTGIPKGVMLTHRNVCSSARAIASYLGNTADDVVLAALPMSFGYGLQQVLVGALVGYSLLIEPSFAFPGDVLARAAANRATGLPGVPSMFSAMVRLTNVSGLDLTAVRYVTNAAANLPVAHIRRLQAILPDARIYCMYGLTECTRVSYLDPDRLDDKVGSVGKAMPDTEAYVCRPDGSRAGPDEVGELVVRGPGVMLGYWNRREETARALRPGALPEELVLHTGDQFRTDADGFLYFVGRTDDVFKTRGIKVAPREVEGAIYELDEVAEVAVIGVPHDIDGRAVKAIVVLRPGCELDERAIRRHCRARLPSHLVPRTVEFRDALPRTRSGKIRTSALV